METVDVSSAMERLAKRRAADMAAAQATLKAQSAPMTPISSTPATVSTPAAPAVQGKAYRVGKVVGGGGRLISGIAKTGAVAAPLAGFGDFKINDPDVDSSAGGVISNIGAGNFADAGHGLQKGAVEAGLDSISGIAKTGDFIAGLGGFKPNLAGRFADTVQNDLGNLVTIDPSTAAAAPNAIPSAAAANVPNPGSVAPAQSVVMQPVAAPSGIISGMKGGTVTSMPATSMASSSPALSRELSAARMAAADRGDFDAVRNSFQTGSGTFNGETATDTAIRTLGEDIGRAKGKRRTGLIQQLSVLTQRKDADAKNAIAANSAKDETAIKQGEIANMNELASLRKKILAEKDPAKRRDLEASFAVLSGKQVQQEKVAIIDVDTGQKDVMGQAVFKKAAINIHTGELLGTPKPAAPTYQEGQKLKGPGGKMFVVKNGVPVPV